MTPPNESMSMNGTSSVQQNSSDYLAWRPPRPPRPASSVSPPLAATNATMPAPKPAAIVDLSTYPNGKRALSGISLRAFLLGTGLGISLCCSIFLVLNSSNNPLWRVPFFLASLCLFHFLEFYITAEYNTREADISAFLLSSNGWAYNIAHGSAVVECLIGYGVFPESRYFSSLFQQFQFQPELHYGIKISVVLGMSLMALGQTVRTLAMAQAGSNFNHTVQAEYKEGHTLVRNGVYALSRHPSYFGFFWWGLGTQLLLGNAVCFVGYTLVLWKFFYGRIWSEYFPRVLLLDCRSIHANWLCRRGKVSDCLLWRRLHRLSKQDVGWDPRSPVTKL